MKNVLKAFGIGLLLSVLALLAAMLGYLTCAGFAAIPNVVGWEAVGLAFTSLVIGCLSLVTIFSIGAIPLAVIDELKNKLNSLEEDEND